MDKAKTEETDYSKVFTDGSFWTKLGDYAKSAGSEVVEKALWLYYAFQQEKTPVWAKTAIVAALGYFISPIDAIPDLVPVVGYADDLGVLALAVTTVATQVDKKVKKLSKAKLEEWFGE